jgi:hypothetical protein
MIIMVILKINDLIWSVNTQFDLVIQPHILNSIIQNFWNRQTRTDWMWYTTTTAERFVNAQKVRTGWTDAMSGQGWSTAMRHTYANRAAKSKRSFGWDRPWWITITM